VSRNVRVTPERIGMLLITLGEALIYRLRKSIECSCCLLSGLFDIGMGKV
jgi:hypothetical protein